MPPSLGISFGLLFCLGFLGSPKGYSIPEGVHIQSECRDRYLWVHVGWSDNAPRFEAVDATGVHPIDEKGDAPQCGYTVSTFRMDVYTTLRASYFSCYTDNQNDELFTFQLYITVTDAKGQPSRYPLTQTCPLPLPWSQREVICEEDYMEVTVGRDVLCTTSEGTSKEAWETAHSIAQKMANSDWQVMFLNNEERMSVTEAQQFGYKLSATPKRVVFRSPYGQSQSEIVMVDGVEVEVIHGTVFFRQNMMVVMVDISLACTKNPGSFDGARLLWDIPRMITPLVNNSFGFESRQINVGVENQLLDESTVRARGYTLKVEGPMVQMGVPFGAEGGYTKSLVIDNVYQETYAAFLFYEHVFSHVYADGGTVETRHRLSRVVDTPLLCRTPFTIDVDTLSPHQKTGAEDSFNVYLGNIPHDVALMGVKLNENQFSVLDATEHGYAISKVDHPNGTHGYTLRVPFDDKSVRRMYLGEGLHQYSVDINYTLSIMPQEEPYFHLASVVKQLSDEFPPELKGVCTQGGIVFTMNQPRLGYLWEIGVGHDPLTPELVTERGYYLKNDSHSLTLEVPWSTVGYTYEDINLRHFYGTFEVLSRDSQTSEIQTSTATRCLFRTDQLIICSTDGTMIVVTNTRPWPVVDPRSTTLSDRTCQPKEADDSRVLFEFGLNTCGTTLTVEDSYVLYENEILSNRESKFRLSVRCIYPLSSVSRLSAENIFKSEVPGVGFITFTGSTEDDGTDGTTKTPVPGCREQVSNNTKSDWDIESQHSLSYYESSTEGPHSPNNGASTAPNTLDPAPSYYNSLKGNTNLDGRAKTSVHTPTPGQYSGTLQEVAIGLHTASQPYNVQPATRPYGATQHIELKPGLSDQKHSQSEVKPATSKYLTLQHHITQKTTGQDDSRSNVKPAPSQAQPMLYEGSQSNRVDQTPIWSSVFQQNIIQQGSNQEGGKRINQQATGQYGGSQNYRVNPAASQPVRIQPATSYYGGIQSGKGDPSHSASQNLQPATNENNCPSSIGVKPSTNWPTPQVNNNHFEKFRLKPEPNQHQGSQSGRNILDSSVYPLHPSSSGPGYYSGSVHEGILRGRHGQ
uniref:ZP domain-containing protein n=1 Tax=Esox lucius TaxID=8010 RepID=A0A3P8ZLR7_ESOLU